jgi:hypothetical protein
MTCGRRPIREAKSPRPFCGTGFENSCDDATLPLICPDVSTSVSTDC